MNRVIKNIMITNLIILLGVTVIGCSKKAEMPSIIGYVTELNTYNENVNILVESKEEDVQYDKANVTVTKETVIFLNGKRSEMDALKEGQKVKVVFNGAVRESYPVQADAKIVTIVE